MNNFTRLIKEDAPDEAVRAMKRIKKRITNRKQDMIDNYQKYIPKDWGIIMTQLRKERWENRFAIQNSKDEMRLNFVVPQNIYMSNPQYWGEVCKNKNLRKKYPEFIVGD